MESAGASLTLSDIRRQPEAWRTAIEKGGEAFDVFDRMAKDAEEVVFMGAGCSYAVALYAQATFQQHFGRPCRAISSMDFFQFPKWAASVPSRSIFVTFSRSGETTETLEAQRYARKLGAKIFCVTATEDAPLAKEAHETLFLPGALEDALLPTVSTTAMMAAMQRIAFQKSEEEVKMLLMERLPEMGAANVEEQIRTGEAAGRDEEIRRAAFLGSGPMLAAAYAGSLMWQMATGLPGAHYPLFEFRHGPMQTCGPDLLLAIMITNAGRREDVYLAREMHLLGAKLMASMTDPIPGMEKAEYRDVVGDLVTDYARSVLALPLFQSLAVHKALALGRDPDDLPGQPPIVEIQLSQY
jgi:fructoselysine-6-P-deglycase FrlB-like protein